MDESADDTHHSDKASHAARAKRGRQQKAEDVPHYPPSNARIFRVASGLEEWSQEEREWMQQHPKWKRFEDRLRAAFKERMGEGADPIDTFVDRLRDKDEKGGPSVAG